MSYMICILSDNHSNVQSCVSALGALGTFCNGLLVGSNSLGEVDASQIVPFAVITPYKVPSPFSFSSAMNTLIRESEHSDVILLNDDALLQTPGGFDTLSRLAHENPEYGVLSAAITGVAKRDQMPFLPNRISDPVRQSRDLALSFVCVYIRREILERIGLLDERFKSGSYGFEDNDYCHRVIQAGWKLGIVDSVVVEHNVTLPSTYRTSIGIDIEPGLKIFRSIWGEEVANLHWTPK